MKYEVELNKHICKRVEVFADNPVAALKLAREADPSFTADSATELLDEDKLGETFTLVCHCENCSRPIFEGDLYATTKDGLYLCAECAPNR